MTDFNFDNCDKCRDKWYKRLRRWVICVAVIFFFLGFWLGYYSSFSEPILFASAEEIDTEEPTSPVIKSTNLIDFSKYIINGTIKVTCDNPLDNGTFSFKGYSDREWQRLINIPNIDDKLKDGNTYTLSQSKYFSSAMGAVYMVIYAYDENDIQQQIIYTIRESSSFTVNFAKYHHYTVSIIFGVPDGFYVDEKISFMFNEGDVALPYQPNLQSIYDSAYNNGLEDGYNNGLEDGYSGGYGQAVKDFTSGLLATLEPNSVSIMFENPGTAIYYSFNNKIFNYAFGEDPQGILSLGLNYPIRNGYRLTITVDSCTSPTLFSVWFVDPVLSVGYTFDLFTIPICTETTSFEVLVDCPISSTMESSVLFISPASMESADTRKGTIFNFKLEVQTQEQDFYDNGYEIGYDDGYKLGFDGGHRKGYAEGINDANAKLDDSSLTGSVTSFVFSLFDAPIDSFMGAMNLQYDGFNLGDLLSFIFTILLIVGIFRLVT